MNWNNNQRIPKNRTLKSSKKTFILKNNMNKPTNTKIKDMTIIIEALTNNNFIDYKKNYILLF